MQATLDAPKQILDNPFFATLNNLKTESGNLSSAKKTLDLVTDAGSGSNMDKLLAGVILCAKSLPTESPIPIKVAYGYQKLWIKNLQALENVIDFVSQFNAIDNSNAKKFISNTLKSIKVTEYIIDYMALAIKTQEAIENIKEKKKSYTVDELKKLIAA